MHRGVLHEEAHYHNEHYKPPGALLPVQSQGSPMGFPAHAAAHSLSVLEEACTAASALEPVAVRTPASMPQQRVFSCRGPHLDEKGRLAAGTEGM